MVGLAPQAAWPKNREACSAVIPAGVAAGVGEGDGDKSELPPPPPQAAKSDAGNAAHNSLENNPGLLPTLAGKRVGVVGSVSGRFMLRLTDPNGVILFNEHDTGCR